MGNKKNRRKKSKRTKSNSVQLEVRADELEKVLAFLPMKDLCRAAQVCKLWNQVANVEMKNRGPEILLAERDFEDSLLNKITVKPYLTICMRDILELGRLARYQIGFHNRPFFGKSFFFVVYNSQISGRTMTSLLQDPMNVPHLILPQTYRKSEIAFACLAYFTPTERFCKEEVGKLRPKDESTHTTYLLFSSCKPADNVIATLLQGLKPKQYTLWGGECDYIFAYGVDSLPKICNMAAVHMVLISIKGPSVVSWSMLIPHGANEDEFKQKLLDFKSTLSLRRFSIGLMIGPGVGSKVDVNRDRTDPLNERSKVSEIFQQIFPGMPFINTKRYPDNDRIQDNYGINSTADDCSSPPFFSQSISIIIISYN